ncbi:glycerol-3-phosphate regulon repressor [Tanticharoenia sakaeratensis NBRC 103193]|nr:glycerol-3-phosphate regulon repressor [Tanticharoenia sakaeratensis NBRC 103193]
MRQHLSEYEPDTRDSERTTLTPRLREIVSMVRTRGYLSNEDLARHFGVAVQTIRRDVNRLADEGHVMRHHGGAGLPSSVENIAYGERQVRNRLEKAAIGRCAAGLITPDAALFINIGTTTEAFAASLGQCPRLRVITNNLHVAATLAPRPDYQVVIAGGTVRSHDGGIVGSSATENLSAFRADFGVIGISGIDEDGSLLDFDVEEIHCARMIMRNSQRVLLLADHTKWQRRAMGCVGHIRDVHDFITDRDPPPGARAMLAQCRTRIHIAPP